MRLPLRLPAILLLAFAASAAVRATEREYDGLVIPFKDVPLNAPASFAATNSPVPSTVTSISVKEGDHVVAGQELAQTYSDIERIDMLMAKADLDKKQFDYDGSKKLYDEKIMSEDDALKIKSDLDLASLTYQRAKKIFELRTIVAPIDGIVVEKLIEVGENLASDQPMFRILDVTRVYVQFYIRAEDLPLLHQGQPIPVRCPVLDPNRVFMGTVDFIDPRVDAASGLMKVKILVPNADGAIRAGIRAKVTIPDAD